MANICRCGRSCRRSGCRGWLRATSTSGRGPVPARSTSAPSAARGCKFRSEEHTSELQSLMRISYAVFCLKKKTKQKKQTSNKHLLNTMTHINNNVYQDY